MSEKFVTRGAGMTERRIKVPETPEEAATRWRAFADRLPVSQPGDWLGDALMRHNAERCRAILSGAGLHDTGACVADRQALEKSGSPEGGAAWIAAHWLAEYHQFRKCRERIEAGDTSVKNLERMIWAAHDMGRAQEEMRWRPSIDPDTGKPREALALSGKRQVKEGIRGNEMKGQRSFASVYGAEAQKRAEAIFREKPDRTWTRIREILASEYKVSPETIKNALRNPKKNG